MGVIFALCYFRPSLAHGFASCRIGQDTVVWNSPCLKICLLTTRAKWAKKEGG